MVPYEREKPLYERLQGLLVTSRETISEEKDERWKSVFSTKILNEIYNKLDGKKKVEFNNSVADANSGELNFPIEFLFKLVSGIPSLKFNTSSLKEKTGCSLTKLIKENKKHNQWNGEKFIPKPLDLARINLIESNDK